MGVKSMTGFGRASGNFEGRVINIDLKSVNHRYFDFNAKLGREFLFLEDKLKDRLSQSVIRGKVELYFYVEYGDGSDDYQLEINAPLVKEYQNTFKKLKSEFNLKNDLTASRIARYDGVLKLKKAKLDEDAFAKAALEVLDSAIESYDQMRMAEGQKLAQSIKDNLGTISATVDKIDNLAADSIEVYKSRLYDKIKETIGELGIDDARVLTEVAIFADKVDVGEETVRLKSHISQFEGLISEGDGAVGKKLDFIVQEMNREINTIGSKCNSFEITKLVVDTKSIIEKIREQIQNIE